MNETPAYGTTRAIITPFPRHRPKKPSLCAMSFATPNASRTEKRRFGSTWKMIFTRSAGAITVLAAAPATPPAASDSSAELLAANVASAPIGTDRRSMYVTGDGESFTFAAFASPTRATRPSFEKRSRTFWSPKSADAFRRVSGTALCSASLAVNPTAAATGALIHVKPTPRKSPLFIPSVA